MAIVPASEGYPRDFPFDPEERYPEYRGGRLSEGPNAAYRAVRESFRLLGYDRERFGTEAWNPLGFLIRPGDRVFLKPNLVTHQPRGAGGQEGDLFSVITHPSVIRAVADYAAIALQGRGEIVVGDNPSIDADFGRLLEITGLDRLEPLYPERFGVPLRVLDLRPAVTDDLKYYGFRSKTRRQRGDPEGSSVLNLGAASYFRGLNPLLFRGVFTNRWETIRHHRGGTHEYCISNTMLNSPVFISIPKLKAHHKVGVTLNVKGLVGINSNKNYLVHWRIGFPGSGGDEFPPPTKRADYALLAARHLLIDLLPESLYLRLRRWAKGSRWEILFSDTACLSFRHSRGAWEGNDTTWRMAADLYRVFVEDASGWRRQHGKEARFFSVVDGILAGEGNGPFSPVAKPARVLVAGEDLLLVDCVAARAMGYDVRAIKHLSALLAARGLRPEDLSVLSPLWDTRDFFGADDAYLDFRPPSGWPNLTLSEGGSRVQRLAGFGVSPNSITSSLSHSPSGERKE